MYVAVIPNRGSPPAILLRESFRGNGKTRDRTLSNLSGWPTERIELLRAVLRSEPLRPAADAMQIVRALPPGHVLAALGTARRMELPALLPRHAPQRKRDLALALGRVTAREVYATLDWLGSGQGFNLWALGDRNFAVGSLCICATGAVLY